MSATPIYMPDLKPPEVIKHINYEIILQQMKDQFNNYQPLLLDESSRPVVVAATLEIDEQGNRFFRVPVDKMQGLYFLDLDSDLITRQLQIAAYREMMQKQEKNESALAVMPAYATGSDLDHIALFYGLKRHKLSNSRYEGDTDFRRRIQYAFDRFTTAGSEESYIAHALNSDSDVKDVAIYSPAPTENIVTILSRVATGIASDELLKKVEYYTSAKKRRPNSEYVIYRSAEIINYSVRADITFNYGPSYEPLLAQAEQQLKIYLNDSFRLGVDITRSAIDAQLHLSGMHEVVLDMDLPITVEAHQAALCTDIDIQFGGYNA